MSFKTERQRRTVMSLLKGGFKTPGNGRGRQLVRRVLQNPLTVPLVAGASATLGAAIGFGSGYRRGGKRALKGQNLFHLRAMSRKLLRKYKGVPVGEIELGLVKDAIDKSDNLMQLKAIHRHLKDLERREEQTFHHQWKLKRGVLYPERIPKRAQERVWMEHRKEIGFPLIHQRLVLRAQMMEGEHAIGEYSPVYIRAKHLPLRAPTRRKLARAAKKAHAARKKTKP